MSLALASARKTFSGLVSGKRPRALAMRRRDITPELIDLGLRDQEAIPDPHGSEPISADPVPDRLT